MSDGSQTLLRESAFGDVGIVGYGRFGRALGELMAEAGIHHRAYDPWVDVPREHRAESLEALVRGVEFVVVAVPVRGMRSALKALRPHVLATQIVLDVGSVKVGPSAALDAEFGAEIPWCATHPLFGPVSLAMAERPMRVVVCPSGAHPAAAARVRSLYESIGCEVIEQSPESHDRVMAHTHALTFFIAKGMIDAGAGMEVPFAPPSFQAFARTIDTVRSDGGHLFTAIARENPFAGQARKELVTALSAIDKALDEAQSAGDEARASERSAFAIPDLGAQSPELKEVRELVDAVDRDIVKMLARRVQLAHRAAKAKANLGAPVLDPAREADVMAARSAWAKDAKLDAEAVRDVFRAIITMSRRVQQT
jgi:prephenate dehydrogenase